MYFDYVLTMRLKATGELLNNQMVQVFSLLRLFLNCKKAMCEVVQAADCSTLLQAPSSIILSALQMQKWSFSYLFFLQQHNPVELVSLHDC